MWSGHARLYRIARYFRGTKIRGFRGFLSVLENKYPRPEILQLNLATCSYSFASALFSTMVLFVVQDFKYFLEYDEPS